MILIEAAKKQWFLIGLVIVFAGVLLDGTGQAAAAGMFLKGVHGAEGAVFLIFLSSGLIIEAAEIRSGFRDMAATFSALLVILVFSPLSALFLGMLPLDKGIIIGLFIVSVMPTTLSSGVVMTGKAGGNMAHALFVTIISNFIAVFSIPLVLSLLLSLFFQSGALHIDKLPIILKLAFIVLLPLFLGLFVKNRFLEIKENTKKILQGFNQLCVILIVFMGVAGVRHLLLNNMVSLGLITAVAAAFHILLLLAAAVGIRVFNIERGRRGSVVFMGAQKTLPLSVIIQMTYFPQYGIALLVCVVHHLVHLIMDGYLSVKLRR